MRKATKAQFGKLLRFACNLGTDSNIAPSDVSRIIDTTAGILGVQLSSWEADILSIEASRARDMSR